MSIDRYNPVTSSTYRRSLESRNLNAPIQDAPYSYGVRVNRPPVPIPNGKGDVSGAFDTEQRRDFDPNYRDAYDYREKFDGQELGRATISRTIQDTAEETLIQEDEFEIIKHEDIDGDGKHEYTIVLAGVTDLSSNGESLTEVGNRHLDIGLNPENYTVRDTDQLAIPSSRNASVDDNRYAKMVRKSTLLDNKS